MDQATGEEGDVDDDNGWINPGLDEVCGDGLDNNCNDVVDENCTTVIIAETGNCGCQSSSSSTGLPWMALLALAALRRRRSA